MRLLIPYLLVPFLAAQALAQATVTEYVTVPPSATTSSSPSASAHRKQVSDAVSSTSHASSARETSSLQPSSSLIQATSTVSSPAGTASMTSASGDGGYDDGSSSGSYVDNDAGASGSSSSSFSISKGGIIAIAVVVSIVAVFGIGSTILFVVAKRRQWNVRASISRASRRLTGRARGPATPGASNRRTTVNAGRLASTPRGDLKSPPRANGHKRGIVVAEKDVEMGALPQRVPGYGQPKGGKWQRLWGNDWK